MLETPIMRKAINRLIAAGTVSLVHEVEGNASRKRWFWKTAASKPCWE